MAKKTWQPFGPMERAENAFSEAKTAYRAGNCKLAFEKITRAHRLYGTAMGESTKAERDEYAPWLNQFRKHLGELHGQMKQKCLG